MTTKSTVTDARTLTIHRPHARLPLNRLGYSLAVPPLSFPEGPPPADGSTLEEALGWEVPAKYRGRVDVVDPVGFTAPSPWEVRFIEYVARVLDVPIAEGWAITDGQDDQQPWQRDLLDRIAGTQPWAAAAEIPSGVQLLRAETSRLEARDVSFRLKGWLASNGGIDACHRALILLPHNRQLMDIWLDELQKAGVPALGVRPVLLSETPLANWIVRVAELVGWDEDTAVSRSALREALDSDFWSANTNAEADGSIRKDLLREALLSLRRPKITFDQWLAQLAALRRAAEQKDKPSHAAGYEALVAFSNMLANALAPGAGQVARLKDLLYDGRGAKQLCWKVDAVARAAAQPEAIAVALRLRNALERLEREEHAAEGLHPALTEEPPQTLSSLLRNYVQSTALIDRDEPQSGVQLLPYELYDGRAVDFLAMAGLSETGFPRAPEILTSEKEAWLTALRLIPEKGDAPGKDAATRWIGLEMERQLQLARTAVGRCSEQLTLSFALQGARDEVVHPGGLLSLLVGGWSDDDWQAEPASVTDLSWPDEVPRHPAAARNLQEARRFALQDAELCNHLTAFAGVEAADELRCDEPHVRPLERARQIDRELWASPGDPPRPAGANSGRLPGAIEPPSAYSASAIEAYGECPYKYFLSRALGLSVPTEKSSTPEDNEIGTLLHNALAAAADRAIAAASDGVWSLAYDPARMDLEQLVEERLAEVRAEVQLAFEEFCASYPTISRAYVDRLKQRWLEAVKKWLTNHLKKKRTVPVELDDESLRAADHARETVEAFDKQQTKIQNTRTGLAELEARIAGFDFKTKKVAREVFLAALGGPTLLAKTKVEKIAGNWQVAKNNNDPQADQRALEEIHGIAAFEKAERSLANKREKMESKINQERKQRLHAVDARVVHAERSFGMGDHPEPAEVEFGKRTLRLKGQIDRIDWDQRRNVLAVRDYKTGKEISQRKLMEESAGGIKLQLLLYAIAVEELAQSGQIDLPPDAPVKQVSLEFLREGKCRGLELTAEDGSGFLLDGNRASWTDLGRAWLASHAEAIESGRFEIAPAKCPKVDYAGSYCDYQWYCPYSPGISPQYERQPGPPIEVDVIPSDDDAEPPIDTPPPIVVPRAQQIEIDSQQIHETHAAGQQSAQNVDRDVLIAAGAGTGKTYNLVLRYLAALASERIEPSSILCVTFTRKAAAQMRHRVRQALFRPDGDEQRTFAEQIRKDGARFRSLVLSLSGAPISTIDALAARIVQEGEEILESTLGVSRSGLQEGLNDAMQFDLTRSFVAQKFTDELEQGNPDLSYLVDRISIHKLKDKMTDLVSGALPSWALDADNMEDLRQRIQAVWDELNVKFKVKTEPPTIAGYAETTARALLIARAWRAELIDELWEKGTPRYCDITERAIEMLGDPRLEPGFRHRLDISHLFVDESQDTSEAQVRLISTIASLTGAKLFWVGDIKQSIYRFRGAEVDVFEKLVGEGDAGQMDRGSLRINRRSSRQLIESFNSLFGGMLPALHEDDRPIDPGSEIAYEPLVHWRDDTVPDGAPPIELIAIPGKGWPLDLETPEGEEQVRAAEHALVTRIGAFVNDKPKSGVEGPEVAVLVHAWWRAYHYQYLLQAAGIRAAVQGGGGLLGTPEATSLLHWLAAATEKSDAALAAVLKGPGIRLSDATLYCLAHGDGVNFSRPLRENLRNAVFHGDFNPVAATEAWAKRDPAIDRAAVQSLLSDDAEALQRFRDTWDATFARCGFCRTSKLFEELIQKLDLEAYWFAVPERGRQAVANLASFIDLVRSAEQTGGTPLALLRSLTSMNNKDQPRATGIDAGVSADVVITTHWQAKGLEWPVVVLPDIQRTDSANGDRGMLPDRLLVPCDTEAFATKTPHWFVGYHRTISNAPLDCEALEELTNSRKKWLGPANRAETRRLLYVAMTRAKRKLLLSGSFDVPEDKKCKHKLPDSPEAYSLDICENWGMILQVCLDLGFDRNGTPLMGQNALLTPEQIQLSAPGDIGLPEGNKAEATEEARQLPDPERMKLWLPLRSGRRRHVTPSELSGPEVAPAPLGKVDWPRSESGRKSVFGTMDHEGSAFHQVMESWAFGGPDASPFSRDLVRDVLEQMGLADTNGSTPRIDRIVELFEMSRRADPTLIETLSAAARRRDLYPEIPVRYTDGPHRLVDGIVDLVWQDEAGWHVLDYKAGWQHPHKDRNLDHPKLRQHFAQTAMYTRGLQKLLPGEVIADFGVWYVASGLVVRWDAAEAKVVH